MRFERHAGFFFMSKARHYIIELLRVHDSYDRQPSPDHVNRSRWVCRREARMTLRSEPIRRLQVKRPSLSAVVGLALVPALVIANAMTAFAETEAAPVASAAPSTDPATVPSAAQPAAAPGPKPAEDFLSRVTINVAPGFFSRATAMRHPHRSLVARCIFLRYPAPEHRRPPLHERPPALCLN
jgi:hypothetical protein